MRIIFTKQIKKIAILILTGLFVLFILACSYFYSLAKPSKNFEWGITFSPSHAAYLGFDWKTLYLDMLNDLKPKKLRLMAYWEQIEPQNNFFYFQDLAEMLDEAERRNIEVIMVVGLKQPRWPECHHPGWYNDLSPDQKVAEQLEMVRTVVANIKQYKAIKVWQVENEALFSFGHECPTTPKEVIESEMKIVRELDGRPIMLTDSGELGRWLPSARLNPDILGSTMYRVVHNPKNGYFKYPLPPAFFKVKEGVVYKFSNVRNIIGVELQAEPWFSDDVYRTDLNTQYALMNPKIFKEYVQYAKDVGFKDNYLWGVEWWYWLAQKHNDWGMWDSAKQLLEE